MSDWIEIGRIVAPQGLDGELRVYPNTDFPERFLLPGKRWLLKPGKTEPDPIELLAGRYIPGKGLYAIELEGIEDREKAEALRDAVLLVPSTDRPHLEPGEFYVQDLIGLPVFNQFTGDFIGTVIDLISAGNDLLEVEIPPPPVFESSPEEIEPKTPSKKKSKSSIKPSRKTILIPFVEPIVPTVDLEQKKIEITPPPGLLDS